jgi:hypothetical protein
VYESFHPIHLLKKIKEDRRLKLLELDNLTFNKKRAASDLEKLNKHLSIADERHKAALSKK